MTEIKKFNQRFKNIPESIWSKIAQIDEQKGQWTAGARLSPQALGRLKRSVLITSTGASTRIEGSRMSDEDVEKLMQGMSIKKFRDRDKQEVKGYYELLENVFNSWKTLKLTEGSINHLHKELLKYSAKDRKHLGEYKKGENKVVMKDNDGNVVAVVFDTVSAYLTPKEMQELVEWTAQALKENKYHPLLVIANFIVEFLNIHPFLDGNGRLSRVLTNMLLLKQGYLYMPYVSHEKLIEDNKADYYIALRRSQKTIKTKHADITPWLEFFFNIFLKQSQMAVKLLSKENIEKLLSQKQLYVWEYLQQTKEATPGEIAQKTKIALPTVRQALDKLMKLKRIERIGQGRSTRYRKI